MPFKITLSGRSLTRLAAACLVSVALPTAPALAQKVKNKTPDTTSAPPEVTVSIPTIDAVDSNIDAETLKAIINGAVAENADALAELDATSITVPEITVSVSSDDPAEQGVLTFRNLVLEEVVDGVAASVSLDGSSFEMEDGTADMGGISAAQFNIAGVLGIYGLTEADETADMQTLYTDFLMEGGSIEAEDVSCEIGPVSGAELRGRPMETSIVEFIALAQQLEDNPEATDPEVLGTVMRMYADMLTSFESSEFTFDGFSCDGVDETGAPMSFSLGDMTMSGMSPGIYPAISMNDFSVVVDGEGEITLDNFTMKQFDFMPVVEALANAPAAVDPAWFEANARLLMPSFEGFTFTGLAMDIPAGEVDGERVVASIDTFDVSLGNYVNGIPSDLDISASGIKADLPKDSDDEQIQQIIDLGLTEIDAGFRVAATWNELDDTILVEEISMTDANLATVMLSGTLSNATQALFSMDTNEALMGASEVAVNALSLDVNDTGLSDLVLALVAAEQNADPATLRPVFAGLAEGTVIGVMAGAADAAKLGTAINEFVSGTAKSLNIAITAKDDIGLTLYDFMAAEQDPTTLIDKVNISASAK